MLSKDRKPDTIMNQNRTSSSRNIWGALIGGILGILAFAFSKPLLPVGCLIGVVTGFYWHELCTAIKKDWLETVSRWKTISHNVHLFFSACRRSKGDMLASLKKRGDFSAALASVIKFGLGIWNFFGRTCAWFGRIYVWPSAHPMNKAAIMGTAAAITFYLLQCLWILPSAITLGGDNPVGLLLFFVSMIALFSGLAPVIAQSDSGHESLDEMVQFYRRYERYVSRGGLRYYFRWIAQAFCFQVLATCFAAIFMFSFAANFAVFIVAMLIPIIVALLAVKTLYRFAAMKAHWPCFIVTCSVTTITAFVLPQYVALEGLGLWLVALGNGATCAFLSEAIRSLLAKTFSGSERLRWFAKIDWIGNDDSVQDRFFTFCFWPANWVTGGAFKVFQNRFRLA